MDKKSRIPGIFFNSNSIPILFFQFQFLVQVLELSQELSSIPIQFRNWPQLWWRVGSKPIPINTKHQLYNSCTMLDQRRCTMLDKRRKLWADVVEMLCNPVNTKLIICKMLDQRQRLCGDAVQMSYECLVFAGIRLGGMTSHDFMSFLIHKLFIKLMDR